MWVKIVGNAKKIFLSLLVCGSIVYADTVDTVTLLSNISASVVKSTTVDGKSVTESTSEAIAGAIVDKVSKALLKKFVIDSGKLVLTEKQKVKILEEASKKMKAKLLPKIKQVKGATPTIIADLAVSLAVNGLADSVKDLINPQTPAEHLAAELASYGVKQARVAWAAKQGMHMAVLESAVIAGEQVFEAVKLRKIVKKMNKDNALQEAKNDAVFKANKLRNAYKRAETQEEKQVIEKQIFTLFHSDNKDENLYLKGAARRFMDNLKVADKRKYFVINNMIERINKKSNPTQAELNHLKEFIEKQFNGKETKYFISMIPDVEDPNKNKLEKLSKKDKELKDKIKTVQKEEKALKAKEERLRRIRDAKRDAFDKVKNAEKGSDEYNYAKKRFFSLSDDYRSLNKEIDALIKSINTDRNTLKTLQEDITDIAINLKSSVDDYNDNIKTEISIEEGVTPTLGELWLGSVTFNSEDRLAGGATKLRYWGGQFDQTVAEAVQYSGGGPIFNGENSYLVDNGKITSFAIGHGENTATDNTKEFHIFDNEIDKTSSFFDQNINTLKLERQLPDGETLSIQTTGHYNYSAWGEWGQTGGLYTDINGGAGIEQKATHNTWQAGQRTQDLPAQGSATYTGVVNGHYYVDSVGSDYGGTVNGTMNMTVDFTNTSVVTGVLNLQKQNGSNFATATMDEMQINRADSGFAGRLVGVDVAARNDGSQNMIIGQFNGPNAEEVSGIWNVTNTNGEFASGTFAGER